MVQVPVWQTQDHKFNPHYRKKNGKEWKLGSERHIHTAMFIKHYSQYPTAK